MAGEVSCDPRSPLLSKVCELQHISRKTPHGSDLKQTSFQPSACMLGNIQIKNTLGPDYSLLKGLSSVRTLIFLERLSSSCRVPL